MSDARGQVARLVSYVFQTTGRRRIGEDDWVRILCYERKWGTPSQMRRLAGAARSLGLLRNAGERDFEMGLEAEGITLPLDYVPDLPALERFLQIQTPAGEVQESSLPLFRRLVRFIANALKVTETEVVGRVNGLQQSTGGLLTAEVAALYYARLQGVDVGSFLTDVEASLRG